MKPLYLNTCGPLSVNVCRVGVTPEPDRDIQELERPVRIAISCVDVTVWFLLPCFVFVHTSCL